MGAMGSDAAIEAADIVLMDDDPMKIAKGIKISRKCIRIVHENIVFALVIKFACLLLGALGIANMWAAIFADVGVMVLAVLNAIRALRAWENLHLKNSCPRRWPQAGVFIIFIRRSRQTLLRGRLCKARR